MAFALERGGARARYARDQGKVDGVAEDGQHRTGKQDRDERSEGVAESGLHAERGEEIERRIHAEHHEVALGEVDDPHDAEDQAEPDAHQAIDRADQKSGGQGLQKAFQRLRSPLTSRSAGVRQPWARCRHRRPWFGHCFPPSLFAIRDHDAGRSSRSAGSSRHCAAMTPLSGSRSQPSTSSSRPRRATAADGVRRGLSKARPDFLRRGRNDIVEALSDGLSAAQADRDLGALLRREGGGEDRDRVADRSARRDEGSSDHRSLRNCPLRSHRARARRRR